MREHDRERQPETSAAPPALLPPPSRRCQICGTPHDAADSILCRVCGEPVLLWGWA